ncbi:MAG: metallophosphoesterase [Ignavibacteriota bacterium]
MSIFTIALFLIATSQIYWAWRGLKLARKWFPRPARRWTIIALVLLVYGFLWFFNFGSFRRPSAIRLTWADALLVAPFMTWAVSSFFGAAIALLFAIPQSIVGLTRWIETRRHRDEPASPGRRVFLERTANVATTAPFFLGAYGLLYGRLNLETPVQKIPLPRLPQSFEGFRIAQLSDIHIGPFMPAEQIRKYVDMANALKPHLTVLTGDFVTFDPLTQDAVVQALSGLKAPFGIFGCLGNHDAWSGVEESITELFRQRGVRILRSEAVAIRMQNDAINLIGTDFQSGHRFGPSAPVANLLGNIVPLIARDRVNILLSHNPDTFDRAAELGVDLSMAGHTHGGQAALEFISPEIAPSRLVTPYVAGWFRKPGGQLYVNRGIGTIGVPIRIGAPPEITLYELTRGS